MKKRDEIADPNSCLNTAGEDDWVFVLKEKDKTMPATIYFWAYERIRIGLNKRTDSKIQTALDKANDIVMQRSYTPEMGLAEIKALRERFFHE